MRSNTTTEESVGEADRPPPATATPDQACFMPGGGCLLNQVTSEGKVREWNDWRWQIRNRIRSTQQLAARFPGVCTTDVFPASECFPMAITPYYASLIETADSSDPIFAQSVPCAAELNDPPCLRDDPLEEDHDMPVPGLVHRYPDRALLLATTTCSVYCRHCTRKRVAGQKESRVTRVRLTQAIDYLGVHPEIKDVIISGGDPFTLGTEQLERVIAAVRSVATVEIIRIGTRTPVVLPMRITDDLVNMLKKYHPIFVNTHFNHPRELTEQAAEACQKLADAGVPLGNQTVLLRGVNDDPRVLEELFRGLVRNRVRPYYLFQCDLVRGVEHFRTPISRGIEIMEHLRGRLSGLAIPSFIVDTPHGGGKVPILPNYIVSMSPTHTVLRSFEGMLVAYPEPSMGAPLPRMSSEPLVSATVADLASGGASYIQPAGMARIQRRRTRQVASTEPGI